MIPSINNPNKDGSFSPIIIQEIQDNDNEINEIFNAFIAQFALPETTPEIPPKTKKRQYDFDENTEPEFLNSFKALKETNEEEFSLDKIVDIDDIDPSLLHQLIIPETEIVPQFNPEQPNGTKSTPVGGLSNAYGMPHTAIYEHTNQFIFKNISGSTQYLVFNEIYSNPMLSFLQRCFLVSLVIEQIQTTLDKSKNISLYNRFSINKFEDILPDNFVFCIDVNDCLVLKKSTTDKSSNMIIIKLRSLDLTELDIKISTKELRTKHGYLSVFRLIIKELFIHEDFVNFKKATVFTHLETALHDDSSGWYQRLILAFGDLKNALKMEYTKKIKSTDAAAPEVNLDLD